MDFKIEIQNKFNEILAPLGVELIGDIKEFVDDCTGIAESGKKVGKIEYYYHAHFKKMITCLMYIFLFIAT